MRCVATEVDVAMETPAGILRNTDFGDMKVAVNSLAAGTDLSPLLEATKERCCQVPHWGYMIEGSITIGYLNGTEDVIQAGDVFYMPSGHNRVVTEGGCTMVEFSPRKEFDALIAELAQIMEASEA